VGLRHVSKDATKRSCINVHSKERVHRHQELRLWVRVSSSRPTHGHKDVPEFPSFFHGCMYAAKIRFPAVVRLEDLLHHYLPGHSGATPTEGARPHTRNTVRRQRLVDAISTLLLLLLLLPLLIVIIIIITFKIILLPPPPEPPESLPASPGHPLSDMGRRRSSGPPWHLRVARASKLLMLRVIPSLLSRASAPFPPFRGTSTSFPSFLPRVYVFRKKN
jgi:hypothetical protein